MRTTSRSANTTPSGSGADIARAIRRAIRSGRGIGCAVTIGSVPGTVVGYNIARRGDFPGERFPLVIQTELGAGKFSLEEVSAS